MKRWESLGAEEVRRLQLEKLNRLLRFHRGRPLYLDLCETVAAPPVPLKRLSDLARYPIVTKDFLLKHRGEIAATPQAYRELSTSGSSGTNLVFYHSREMVRERTACVHQLNGWIGYDNWCDPAVTVWGESPYASARKRAVAGFKRFALNTRLLSSFGMDDAMALRYARYIHRVRPTAVDGYPSYLSRVARVALKMGVPPFMDAVVMHSGEQALPSDLEAIRDFFGHRVFARYGSREFGPIAHEVPDERGYRVAPTRFIVENGADGELLITDLDNLATPFIRYHIGDAGAVMDEPDDSVTAQRIMHLEGRIHDRLETPDGRLVPGQFWTLLARVPGVEAFQVVQRAPDHVELRVQVGPTQFRNEERDRVMREATKLLGPATAISIVLVSEVDRTRMGKRRFVVRDY